ncbi:hypothetical protein CRG98_033324 [Punica granatum]|uniref:Uncharacterized protein n=1 Tax=Punica granatum TaxID=22663 RepID=A0A2I0IQK3_PUNGR|nr:hypothetical protein CRG98_033324 [Punica granatum]
MRNMVLSQIGAEALRERILPDMEETCQKALVDWSTKESLDVKKATSSVIFDFTAKLLFGFEPEKNMSERFSYIFQGLLSFPLNIPGTVFHKCLKKEHQEILQNRERREGGVTWKEYKSMNFTMQVVNESLRMLNVGPGIMRRAIRDIHVNGYTIPEGWTIVIAQSALQLNPETYDDPLSFNPWRWKEMKQECDLNPKRPQLKTTNTSRPVFWTGVPTLPPKDCKQMLQQTEYGPAHQLRESFAWSHLRPKDGPNPPSAVSTNQPLGQHAQSFLNFLLLSFKHNSRIGSRLDRTLQRALVQSPKTPYRFCRSYLTCLSSWDLAPRAFPRTTAHGYPHSGKVLLCGPQSRSNHSRMVMTKFSKNERPHARNTPITSENRCTGSHPLENSSRVLFLILQQGEDPTKR